MTQDERACHRRSLAQAIRSLRKRLGRNQSEFAELLGVRRNTVSRYELGTIIPSLRILIGILGCAETRDEKDAINQAFRLYGITLRAELLSETQSVPAGSHDSDDRQELVRAQCLS